MIYLLSTPNESDTLVISEKVSAQQQDNDIGVIEMVVEELESKVNVILAHGVGINVVKRCLL